MLDDRSVNVFANCPYCTLAYDPSSVRVLSHGAKRTIFHVTCTECRHSMLLSMVKNHNGVVGAGVFTDCGFDDAKRFLNAEKISVDDVLETHTALKFDNFL